MPENAIDPRYTELAQQLEACTDSSELFKLASSRSFKDESAKLSRDDLGSLRGLFAHLQKTIRENVKLERFDGQILCVYGVDSWYSPEYKNHGVTLKYWPEDAPTERFKSLTSAPAFVRLSALAEDLEISESAPLRIEIKREPVLDPEGAKKGFKSWHVRRLGIPGAAVNTPF